MQGWEKNRIKCCAYGTCETKTRLTRKSEGNWWTHLKTSWTCANIYMQKLVNAEKFALEWGLRTFHSERPSQPHPFRWNQNSSGCEYGAIAQENHVDLAWSTDSLTATSKKLAVAFAKGCELSNANSQVQSQKSDLVCTNKYIYKWRSKRFSWIKHKGLLANAIVMTCLCTHTHTHPMIDPACRESLDDDKTIFDSRL